MRGLIVAVLSAIAVGVAGPATAAGTAPSGRLVVSKISCKPCWAGIALVSPGGGGSTTVTKHVGWYDNGPVFSPDGKWIAFSRTTNDYGSFHVYVMRADGHGVRQLTHGRFDDRPAWSPDGKWIAFQSLAGIELIRPNGTGKHVVKGTYQASDPAWSPDGRSLTFSQHRYIWTARTDGRSRHRIVAGYDPAWSPNGRTIAFMPSNGGVALVGSGGGRSRFLGTGMEPSWSPDGKWIAFTRWPPDDRFYVWVMRADGRDRRLVMRNARTPSWRPT